MQRDEEIKRDRHIERGREREREVVSSGDDFTKEEKDENELADLMMLNGAEMSVLLYNKDGSRCR